MMLWRGAGREGAKEMGEDRKHSGFRILQSDQDTISPTKRSSGDASSSERGWREVDEERNEPSYLL